MPELRTYLVDLNGAPTTMLLSDEDAERLGGRLVAQVAVEVVEEAGHLDLHDTVTQHKQRIVPNRARRTG